MKKTFYFQNNFEENKGDLHHLLLRLIEVLPNQDTEDTKIKVGI